ncbi:MAG: hypothetical protein ACOC58_03280, partial [Chloroflexota bacterium]
MQDSQWGEALAGTQVGFGFRHSCRTTCTRGAGEGPEQGNEYQVNTNELEVEDLGPEKVDFG